MPLVSLLFRHQRTPYWAHILCTSEGIHAYALNAIYIFFLFFIELVIFLLFHRVRRRSSKRKFVARLFRPHNIVFPRLYYYIKTQ